jgi:hypothetical protein
VVSCSGFGAVGAHQRDGSAGLDGPAARRNGEHNGTNATYAVGKYDGAHAANTVGKHDGAHAANTVGKYDGTDAANTLELASGNSL